MFLCCGHKLRLWGKTKFGNLNQKISLIQRSISEINNQITSQESRAELHEMESHLNQLLDLQEHYWHQSAGTDWLAGGDRNTSYFYRRANRKKQKNFIRGILSSDNLWISEPNQVSSLLKNYFQNLFISTSPSEDIIEQAKHYILNCISPVIAESLDASFSADEVKNASFDMKPWKAPGPDGFHAVFIQNQWSLIGNLNSKVCLGILNEGHSYGNLNQTNVILIPKIPSPSRVEHFPSISLCNVLAKVLEKMLANRLKGILPLFIFQEQSAFVPGRQILDNVMISFECLL